MKTYSPNEIKNIALVGSAGSGKTTLAEAMMYEGGVIPRRGSVSAKIRPLTIVPWNRSMDRPFFRLCCMPNGKTRN